MTRINELAFEAIYNGGCEDYGDWEQEMIANYGDELVEAFGSDPIQVRHSLADMWADGYEDTRTGVCLSYRDWAIYFSNEFSHVIYNELIEAKKPRPLVSYERMDYLKSRMKELLEQIER